MSHERWQDALAALVQRHGLRDTELGDTSRRASGNGYRSSSGIVGALGPLTPDSETPDPLQIGVFSTPDVGLSPFRGRMWLTSSQLREVLGGVFTVTVCLDSETALRLHEGLSLMGGEGDTDAVGFYLTIRKEGQRST